MRIAVEGCCHGDLDKIYETIQYAEKENGIKVDLLICCGDFQAVRNEQDLDCLSCPPKYREMKDFYRYYSGQKKVPIPTVFIGGNHEASNHMWELYFGGLVCPDIYFLGHSGVISFGGLRIAGISGIYKEHDYRKGYFEKIPFHSSDLRSIYHIREYEVMKLQLLKDNKIDVFISHDWPKNITNHGNLNQLLKTKPFLEDEIKDQSFGAPPLQTLLNILQPDYYFAGHMHVKFPAIVKHSNSGRVTRFLALDKCLPRGGFLQILDVNVPSEHQYEKKFYFDEEWLAILKTVHPFFPLIPRHLNTNCSSLKIEKLIAEKEEHRKWIQERIKTHENGIYKNLKVPDDNFVPVVPAYDPNTGGNPFANLRAKYNPNPQTIRLLKLLQLDDVISKSQSFQSFSQGNYPSFSQSFSPSTSQNHSKTYPIIEFTDECDDDDDQNPEEIELDV